MQLPSWKANVKIIGSNILSNFDHMDKQKVSKYLDGKFDKYVEINSPNVSGI